MNSSDKIAFLKNIDLFGFFHDSTLERLVQESREWVLKEEIVFNEGDLGQPVVLRG